MEIALPSSQPQVVYKLLSGDKEVKGQSFLYISHYRAILFPVVFFPVSDIHTIFLSPISHFYALPNIFTILFFRASLFEYTVNFRHLFLICSHTSAFCFLYFAYFTPDCVVTQNIQIKNVWKYLQQLKSEIIWKTNNQQQPKVDLVIEENTVANATKHRNVWDPYRRPHIERQTLEALAFYNLCLLVEMPELEVVPPRKEFTWNYSLQFKLLHNGDFQTYSLIKVYLKIQRTSS